GPRIARRGVDTRNLRIYPFEESESLRSPSSNDDPAPRASSLFPPQKKKQHCRDRAGSHDQDVATFRGLDPVQSVHDARQRIQERGRLVGKDRRDSSEGVLHDALRDEEKVREGAEKRPLERGRAEVLSSGTAVVAAPAGAGHRRGHTLPGREGRSRARRLAPAARAPTLRPRPGGGGGARGGGEPLRPLRDESPHREERSRTADARATLTAGIQHLTLGPWRRAPPRSTPAFRSRPRSSPSA